MLTEIWSKTGVIESLTIIINTQFKPETYCILLEVHRNKYYMYIHLLLERIWLSFSMKWRQILPESKTCVSLVNNKPGAQKVGDWVTNSYSEPPPPNDLQWNNRWPKQNKRVTFVWQNIYLLRQIKSVLSFVSHTNSLLPGQTFVLGLGHLQWNQFGYPIIMAHFSWLFSGAKASRLNKTEESPKVENNFAFAQPCY